MTLPRRMDRDDGAFSSTLAAAAAGDESALSTIYRIVHPRVIRYLFVVEPDEAERLAAETWTDVVGSLGDVGGNERALYGLALAAAYARATHVRSRAWRRLRSARASRTAGRRGLTDVDDGAAGNGLRMALASIARLPREQAEIVLLRILGDVSLDDAARIVGKRRRTAEALQRRALRKLEWTPMVPAAR